MQARLTFQNESDRIKFRKEVYKGMGKQKKTKSTKNRKAPRTVPVKPHVREGKSIDGHKRTLPDGIKSNNYSSK